MPQEIRLWEVTPKDSLKIMTSTDVNFEDRLENWLENDISVLDPNLMVIGRQVLTDLGDKIDLLCLDVTGSLVIVELKRGRTPREIWPESGLSRVSGYTWGHQA